MLRARLSNGTFLLGMDATNVKRLKAGDPIVVDLSLLGGRDRFMLVYGDTLQAIMQELERVTGEKLPPAQPFHDPKDRQ